MGEDDYFFGVVGHVSVNAVPQLWGEMEQIALPFDAVAGQHDVERQTGMNVYMRANQRLQ